MKRLDNTISKIIDDLKTKYGIDENFYPNINLYYHGGLEKELKLPTELATTMNISPDTEFYKNYLEEKKDIIKMIKEDEITAPKFDKYGSEITGADEIPALLIASNVLTILYTTIIHPYLSSYFGKLGEMKAEERKKEKNRLMEKIDENIETKFEYEEDKKMVKIIIIQYINRKFKN